MKRIVKFVLAGLALGWAATFVAALRVKSRIVPTVDPAADDPVIAAILGPLDFVSTARGLRGGAIECWYGGGLIDLRDATLSPAGAVFEVRAVFGGGQILVPPSWRVTVRMSGIGGVQDVRPTFEEAGEPRPELVLQGLLLFGGFAIDSAAAG